MGKPVQAELSAETELDVALDGLVDLANGKRIKTKNKKKRNEKEDNSGGGRAFATYVRTTSKSRTQFHGTSETIR